MLNTNEMSKVITVNSTVTIAKRIVCSSMITNLLSVSELTTHGKEVSFTNDGCDFLIGRTPY